MLQSFAQFRIQLLAQRAGGAVGKTGEIIQRFGRRLTVMRIGMGWRRIDLIDQDMQGMRRGEVTVRLHDLECAETGLGLEHQCRHAARQAFELQTKPNLLPLLELRGVRRRKEHADEFAKQSALFTQAVGRFLVEVRLDLGVARPG